MEKSDIWNRLLLLAIVILALGLLNSIDGRPQQYQRRPGRFRFENSENQLNNAPNSVSYQPGFGGTGISCKRPGHFVLAPDGCNRCFCEQNGELSPACSRALCPPGFPSGSVRTG